MTRLRESRAWVVSFSMLRPFGPHRPALRRRRVVSGCTSGKPKILVEDVSTETWTAVKAVVGDLLLALRGDEVLFVREVDGPADVTVVAS